MIKRAFDIVISAGTLIMLFPVLATIAILVRMTLGRPVIFSQVRPGLGGKPFRMYKFRSMTEQRDSSGALLPDSDRLTRFGQFLRATSLDELPEIWNVLKGDMSLVGPRPLLMEYLPLYSKRQSRRHEVRPGLTGWAQVNGRNNQRWEARLDMDVWYVENQSLVLDLKILLLTVKTVLTRQGIQQDGHATMKKFTGSGDE